MQVFNNQQRSGYEEISSYSPNYYRHIREMDAVFRFAGWLTDMMAADMEGVVSGQFLPYMNKEALERYEAFLGIGSGEEKTVEERKAYIMALLIGTGKLSSDKIKEIVNQFTECECDVVLRDSALYINMVFNGDPAKYMGALRDILRKKVPAHIGVVFHGRDGLEIVVELVNDAEVERVRCNMTLYLYSNGKVTYLDGGAYLNGSLLLDSMFDLYPVRQRHVLEVQHTENFEEGLTVKRNYHLFDGSLTLDGNTVLNAEAWKEEI